MDKDNLNWLMEAFKMDHGKMVRCLEKELIHGLKDNNTQYTYFNIKTLNSYRVIGKMENIMDKDN